jgi:hypothetical protein
VDDQHRALRLVTDKERQIAREGRTLGIRLDNALRQARMLSEAPTSNLDLRVSRGKSQGSAPPRIAGLLSEPESASVAEVYERRLRLMVEALEREVDAHVLRPTTQAKETREEKDVRLARDYVGFPSHIVSFIDPTLGSPRSIERARARAGVRPVDGRENS